MRKRHPHWIIFAILLILTPCSHTLARADAPWYQFEIIIFERIAKGAGSTEVWPEDPGTPSLLDARPMRISARAGADNESEPVAYAALPRSAWQLTELTQRLRRSRNFRPHVHLAWRQQMVHPDRAQQLYIEMMDRPDARNRVKDRPKIEGTLKVGVKRYLHLETDLLLRRSVMDEPSPGQTGLRSLGPAYQTYRLQAQRRMRSGKLHYLDHPVIGVLVLASKFQPAKTVAVESAAPDDSDLDSPPPADDQSATPLTDPEPAATPSPQSAP